MFEIVFLVIIGTLSNGANVQVAEPTQSLAQCEAYKRQVIVNGTNGVAAGEVKPGFRVECQTKTFTVQAQ